MNPKKEEKKETLSELMCRSDVAFSMRSGDGWANISFEKDYKGNIEMLVKFFNEDGNPLQDEYGDGGVPVEEVEKIAKFITAIKEMKLPEYEKKA